MASSEAVGISRQKANEDIRFERFTSTTVHHLREPVRMMGVYTEMLKSAVAGRLDGDALQAIDFLQQAAMQMQKLLDGMGELVTATAKTGRQHSSLRLELPLRQALLILEPALKAANATVTYADLPTIQGDFDGLRLVFQHLIRNAVQYRGAQPPEITVASRPSDAGYIVEVRDNGPGIPAEFHERIFELYARLHGKEMSGNGLGLSVSRAIVEAHGGAMWVESVPDQGCRFCFTLNNSGMI